ncbi:hypothetical protein V492_00206 [Pseudogymnoascus sp. VKM F-4246]|nr:hypothetical protein V492_00206 [Pseudogymnoascus sp. VKM F-4246]
MKKLIALVIFISCLVQLSFQQEPQCSSSKLCPEGCCSSAGFCGYGPDYCSNGCQSTCDAKSGCNPGWTGSQYSEKDSCPLNVCCSKSGWCGTTEEFCGDNKVVRPSCAIDAKAVSRVIGYYEAWAPSKRSRYSMLPEEIPYGQYTHIIFSFATINPSTFKVSAGDYQTELMMSRIGAIKFLQPDIKIWVALGGWAFNDPGRTQTTFSDIASSTANINIFLDSLVQMMNKYGFDGVDIDWEYPVAEDRNGRPEDYKNIVTFMTKLHSRMKDTKKGTSMALPASYWYLQNFDIKALEPQVDWFNIMSYDEHGSWDIDNDWIGPWANSHTNMTDIQMALDLLWRNDISPSKVTMGMAFYSRSFTLTDPACSALGCRISSGGNPGKYSDTVGVLLHAEIQEIIAEKKLTPVLDRVGAVKTVSWDNQWVSFDDVATWRLKANIARSQCIEGFMVWAMSQDDEKGTNILGLNQALGRKTPAFPDFTPTDKPVVAQPIMAPKLCRWSGCFAGCPTGFKTVPRDGYDEIMLDANICSVNDGASVFCCPAEQTLPTCAWRGHKNSGNCSPGCEAGEVEVGTLSLGCKKNYQSACCTSTAVTAAYGACRWTSCVDDPKTACTGTLFSTPIKQWSDKDSCSDGKSRGLCCSNPPPAAFSTSCKWVPKAGYLNGPGKENVCEGQCPSDSVQISLKQSYAAFPGGSCIGPNAFCCPDPKAIVPRTDEAGDSDGAKAANQFKLVLIKYMKNPTCPATLLEPTLSDQYGGAVTKKRNLAVESREYEILQGRATDCTLNNWNILLGTAVLMFTKQNVGFDAIRKMWDENIAATFDDVYEVKSLALYKTSYPWLDWRAFLEYILINPRKAGSGMRDARETGVQLCQLAAPPVSKRKLSKQSYVAKWAKRAVWPTRTVSTNDDSPVPSLQRILTGIEAGDLSLHYARWQYAEGTSTDFNPGPFLELAYWIGPSPSVYEDEEWYDGYRDMTSDSDYYDSWVVFHLHIDPSDEAFLISQNGHTYVAVPHVSIYHGQFIELGNNQDGAWRVSGERTRYTRRTGWDCPAGGGSWYVGAARDMEGANDLTVAMHAWGEQLWADGYMATLGLRLIIEPPPGSLGGEINPSTPGTLVHGRSARTSAAQLGNPYWRNFLIDRGNYLWQTARPPGAG